MMMRLRNKNRIARDKSQSIVFGIYFVILLCTSFLFLYPFFWIFQNTMKSAMEFRADPNALPSKWDFGIFVEIFKTFKDGNVTFIEMIWNSVWLTFGGQALNILASVCVAYPLARYKFPFHRFLFGIIIFRITIPVIGASAAGYKFMFDLGLINKPAYLINYFNGFDMNALIMYGYFKAIDKGYSEAAYIDGANCFQILFKIIIPQAMPCILALYVRCIMGYWNVYTTTQVYLSKYPNLALGIYNFEQNSIHTTNGNAKYFGAIIISSLVPIILFGFSQKTMLKNMSVGGLKG